MGWRPAKVEDYHLYLSCEELGVLIEKTPNFMRNNLRKYMWDKSGKYTIRIYFRPYGEGSNARPTTTYHIADVLKCFVDDSRGNNARNVVEILKKQLNYETDMEV